MAASPRKSVQEADSAQPPRYLRNVINGAVYPYDEKIAHLGHIEPYYPKGRGALTRIITPTGAVDPRNPVILDSQGRPVRPAVQAQSRAQTVVERTELATVDSGGGDPAAVLNPLGDFGENPFEAGGEQNGGAE